MERFKPERETCPICGSTGNCHIHHYYGRSIIDFKAGRQEKSDLCILRVFCDSCRHTHAILPDVIIPYSSYSLFFVLRLLGEYFAGLFTIEQLCERYDISQNQFFKWLALWKSHKKEWLGLLDEGSCHDGQLLLLLHGLYPATVPFLPAVPQEPRTEITQKCTVSSDCLRSGYFHLLTTRPWDGYRKFLRL